MGSPRTADVALIGLFLPESRLTVFIRLDHKMAATTRNKGALWSLLSHLAQKKNTRDFYLFESHGLWCHKWTFCGVSFDLVYDEGPIVIMRDNTKFVAQIVSDVFPRSVSDIRKCLKGLFMSTCALFPGELINLAMFCERIRRRFWPEWFVDVEDLFYDGDSESSRGSSPEGLLDFGLFSRTDTLDDSDASSHLTGNTHTNCPDSDHSLFDSDVGTGSDNDTQLKEDLMPELEVWPEYAHDGLTLTGCSVPPPSPLNGPPSWCADWVSIWGACRPNLIHAPARSVLSRNIRTVVAAASLCLTRLTPRCKSRCCLRWAWREHLIFWKLRRLQESVADKTGGTSLAMKRCN